MKQLQKILAAASLGAAMTLSGNASAVPATALYLTMDGSGSISTADFTLQINGYINALNAVFTATPSLYGQVAIGGGIFGANFSQFFAVTEITNSTVLGSLTTALAGLDPSRGGISTGATAIGDAITASALALTGYETSLGANIELLIDVTTDGQNNLGSNPATVAAAVTSGPQPLDAVNCLGIGAGANCTWVGSSGTNFGTAANFAAFESALTTKLQQELGAVPEPTVVALLGAGIAGLGFSRRKSKS